MLRGAVLQGLAEKERPEEREKQEFRSEKQEREGRLARQGCLPKLPIFIYLIIKIYDYECV